MRIPFHIRSISICVFAVAITSVLAQRLINIHIVESDKYQTEAAKSYVDRSVIKAKRGFISDAKGNMLTNNIVNVSLIADRYRIDDTRIAALGPAYSYYLHSPEWQTRQAEKEYIDFSEEDKLKDFNKRVEKTRRRFLSDLSKKENEEGKADALSAFEAFWNADDEDGTEDTKSIYEQVDPKKVEKLLDTSLDYSLSVIAQRLQLSKEDLKKKFAPPEKKQEALTQATPKEQPAKDEPAKEKKKNAGKVMRVVLAQNLTEDQQEQLEKDFKDKRIQGFSFERKERRFYTIPDMIPHVIGYTNHENVGQAGIESYLNKYLCGQDGFRLSSRDARGLPLSSSLDKLKPAVHGLNMQISIDMSVQAIAEEELEAGLKEMDAQKGCVLVVEPKTGNILAMAVRPTFNINNIKELSERKAAIEAFRKENPKKEAPDNPEINFAIQGIYEPGSTFKVVAVSGALDSKKVTLNTPINCGGRTYQEGAVTLSDTHSYGGQNVLGVVRKSSNIGTYKIAQKIGWAKFFEYFQNFGFGQKSGIPLTGEIVGIRQDPSNVVNFSRMCIGYAEGVTPIQMVMAYATIANKGVRMRPRLVTRIFDNNNKDFFSEETAPQEVMRVISEQAAKDMCTALHAVTEEGGTGKSARVPGFNVGGKTGTARRFSPVHGGYADGQYVCSFAGMLPVEDPAFVCLVVVDNPRTTKVTHYGGTVAGPIFQKVCERLAKHLNLTPTVAIPAKKASS